MSQFFVPLAASYPQTGANRPVSDILDDLADYVGGGDRPAAQARARRSLHAAVRMFNAMPWKFARQRQTITLLDNTSDYALAGAFRSPRAALLIDTGGKSVAPLEWVPYEDWARYDADELGTATSPDRYTARNQHETGLLTFLPPLGIINTQYPSVRLDYHQRIVVPAADNAVLGVPQEVEEAIVQEAVAIIVSKSRSFVEARDARAVARDLKAQVLNDWRDWPDPGLTAVGGSVAVGSVW